MASSRTRSGSAERRRWPENASQFRVSSGCQAKIPSMCGTGPAASGGRTAARAERAGSSQS